MKLSEFFDHLAYGELSQYGIGTDDAGKIAHKDFPRMTTLVNSGLAMLHTRLRLKLSQVLVQTNALQSNYVLSKKYSVALDEGVDDGINRCILDESSPFQDDVILIEQVVNQDGEPFSVNDINNEYSIYLPNYREIQFSKPKDEVVAVLYQANHPKIQPNRGMDPDNIDIDLPEYCTDILAHYCMSRLLSGGSAENQQISQMYLSSVERQIVQIEESGLIHSEIPTNENVWRKGWV